MAEVIKIVRAQKSTSVTFILQLKPVTRQRACETTSIEYNNSDGEQLAADNSTTETTMIDQKANTTVSSLSLSAPVRAFPVTTVAEYCAEMANLVNFTVTLWVSTLHSTPLEKV
jgi:hypothetical protein